MRGPSTAAESGPGSPRLERARGQRQGPNAAKNQSINQGVFYIKKIK